MNKRNINDRFDFARRIDVDATNHEKISRPSVEVEKTPNDTLLSIVYAPDERTGLPCGDINYYVSERVNPDVREFILANLMRDVSVAKNIANPSGLSDDALLELSRGSSENVDDYVLRLNKEISDFKFMKEMFEKQEKQDVPPKSD